MPRISVSLSDEAYEALRQLAFREKLQVAVAARTLIYGALSLVTPEDRIHPQSPDCSADRRQAPVGDREIKPDFKR